MSTATGNGTALTTAAQRDFSRLRKFLNDGKEQLAMAAAKNISADKLIRLALTAATKQPKLFSCSPESVGLALLTASAFGLEPDGWNGHLVPYKTVCQFLPDYKGFIQLIYQNQRVRDVQAQAIYEADQFEYEYGSNAYLKHRPANSNRGELIGSWAMVRFKDGAETFVVATEHEILKRRDASAGYKFKKEDNPWTTWPAEMYAKTAVKMLAKRAPLGEQVERLADYDSAVDCGKLVIGSVDELNQVTTAESKPEDFSLGEDNA